MKNVKDFFNGPEVKKRFDELMGNRAGVFLSSVFSIINKSDKLQLATTDSLYTSAIAAATLNLALNDSLGYAYIVPYNNKKTDPTDKTKFKWVTEAQFQIGWKGLIQLAQRSGQYKLINVTDVRKGELKRRDRLTGEYEFSFIEDDEERLKLPIIGFASYFKLNNGFEKVLYMTEKSLQQHAAKFSKTYKEDTSKWKTDFEGMSMKTVLKLNLNKYGPMSVDMQTAVLIDQAVLRNPDNIVEGADYVDTDPSLYEDIHQWQQLVLECKSVADIEALEKASVEQIDGNPILQNLFRSAKTIYAKQLSGKEKGKAFIDDVEAMLSKAKGKQ